LIGLLDIISEKKEFRMAYSYKNSKGTTYYLHATTRTLESGKQQHLYFFAKTVKAGALNAVPDGYMVAESKSGLPVLKKK
jgi:hypothetical protein